MTRDPNRSGALEGYPTDQKRQYTGASSSRTQQISHRFEAGKFLLELDRVESVVLALLCLVNDPERFGFGKGVVFRADRSRNRLVGWEAASRPEVEFGTELHGSLEESDFQDAHEKLAAFEKGRDRSLGRKVRRIRFSLEDTELAPVAAVTGSDPDDASAGFSLEDPIELDRAIGSGEWSYWPLPGVDTAVGVLCLLGPHPGDLELLEWICCCAGTAIERLLEREHASRLHRERTSVSEAVSEVLRATNLEDLLGVVARTAARGLDAHWGTIWVARGPESKLSVIASCGRAPDSDVQIKQREDAATICLDAGRPRIYREEPAPDPDRVGVAGDAEEKDEHGLMVPLQVFDRGLGVLAVGGRRHAPSRSFDAEDERFLTSLAAQASLAVRNVQIKSDLRSSEQRLRETQTQLLQSERLASVGEHGARLASEIGAPLKSIGELARQLAASVDDEDPNANRADRICREIMRLESIVGEQLGMAKLQKPRLMMVDLASLVREAIENTRGEAKRRGVKIEEEHEGALPKVLLDHEKVLQVLSNILGNMLESLSPGRRLLVRTVHDSARLTVELANDGEPLARDILDQLFVPFANARPGGSGLGLAVARQIVLEHGGEIEVQSGDSWTVLFKVSFPIRDNQDRRKSGRDRRKGRDRRHAA